MRLESINKIQNLSKPVLITGHTGFKGTWLTLLLESHGIEVVGISLEPDRDSLYTKLNRRGKIFEKFFNICDLEELKTHILQVNPGVVFHLAAQSLVLESFRDPITTFKTNIIGTANLLESINYLRDKTTVVSITSDKVYENLNNSHKFTEDEKLKGKDPYSASKVGAESVIFAWKNLWDMSASHKICSARAGNVVGGGDMSKDRLIPDIVRSINSKNKVQIRNPSSRRPWQHVLDPLVGYIYTANALLEGKSFESINFGPTEKSLTVNEVLNIAIEEFQNKFEFEIVDRGNEKFDLESNFLDLDSRFANNELSWYPKWNQKEAISRTCSWWNSLLSNKLSPAEACEKDISDLFRNNCKAV
jgi:CDP-glucose 4,6-dehydratase